MESVATSILSIIRDGFIGTVTILTATLVLIWLRGMLRDTNTWVRCVRSWILARKIEGYFLGVSCDESYCFRRARAMYKYTGGKNIAQEPLSYFEFYDMEKKELQEFYLVLCGVHLLKHLRISRGSLEFVMPNWFTIKFRNRFIGEHGAAVNVPGWLQEASLRMHPKGVKCKKCNLELGAFTLSLASDDGNLYDELLSVLLKPCKDDGGATVLVYSSELIHDPSFTYQDRNGGKREYDSLPSLLDRPVYYEIDKDGRMVCTF